MKKSTMKYGKHEFERTYLLSKDCLIGNKIDSTKRIKDKYIEGTSLRLRRVVGENYITYKLTKKEKLNPPKRGILKINTLYLSKEEYERISHLDGIEIEKERYVIKVDQTKIGIDRVILNDRSIYIGEIEFETENQMNAFKMPFPYFEEITGNDKYSGYEIAKEYSRFKTES